MKKSVNEIVGRKVEYDEAKVREYLDEMIAIANMFPKYEFFGDAIPDYEVLLHLSHTNNTGKPFALDPNDDDVLEAMGTIVGVWNVIEGELIEKQCSKVVNYVAVGAYDSVIGEEVFEEVLSDEVYKEIAQEVMSEAVSEEASGEKKILEMLKRNPVLVNYKPEVVKLQNFIRLTRIAHNMRYVAYVLHKRKNANRDIRIITAYKVDWKDIFYEIPGRVMMTPKSPFHLICKYQNNKETGKFHLNPSFMEWVLSEIDILQIKICGNCFDIFFAEPRNMKYCKSQCNDKMKSRRYDRKRKRLDRGGISEEELHFQETFDYIETKRRKRGWVDENGDFHPFDK